ncbi:hypothetical protein BD410DRAFT_752351 [Rickenella mellea]|uniref:Uncharacterized protein n=1 Tax=Rickenella mellea TaxID=50990 RepID=A0A4Y7PWD9_9AGAM|nr:hypothetical protein BD410DRAFT_752351 [Rickenella mellea]
MQLSTARMMAPASLAINFGAQLYGSLSKPNIKDIADANHYAFSPNPYFIGAFFAPQLVLQLLWLRQFFVRNGEAVEPPQLSYAPIDVIGNMSLAAWMVFWQAEQFGLSELMVAINTFSQLYAVSQLPPVGPENRLTHFVAKSFAGIGILDLFDNGGVAMRYPAPPSFAVQAMTSACFLASSVMSDWIMGGVLVYDLVAMAVGQKDTWGGTLGWLGGACAAIVVVKNAVF